MLKKVLAIAITILMLASCSNLDNKEQNSQTEINPAADAQNVSSEEVTLYFGNADMSALIPEKREIVSPVNERIEVSVMTQLIKGPQRGEFSSLINQDTEIISVSDRGGFLFVTLSSHFLEFQNTYTDEMKALTVYSIVNTLIELTGFDRVQLLVDMDNSGNGQRIKSSLVGLKGETSLEPLGYNTDLIMTPQNTLDKIFSCLERNDYVTLYSLISTADVSSEQKPLQDEFIALFSTNKIIVDNYQIQNSIVNSDGQSCMVFCDYKIKIKEQETSYKNSPVRLYRENNIWKMRYKDFAERFLAS